MRKEEIINGLIEEYGYESYLEIGVQHGHCYSQIKAKIKAGVDVNTDQFEYDKGHLVIWEGGSDDYFDLCREMEMTYDLIFIDGDHKADQVLRDLNNAMQIADCVVLHDVNPDGERFTKVPRQTSKWFGEVYKVFYSVYEHSSAKCVYLPDDCGVGIIRDWDEGERVMLHEISFDEYKEWTRSLELPFD